MRPLARPLLQSGGNPVVPGAIVRSRYSIAGQTIATRVSGDPASGNNGLFFFYSDHLGSSSLLVNDSNNPIASSRTWYRPFGGYRGTAPTQTISDRDFTGQRENMELGLLYYNARFYVPGIGRFASADTIVPDPLNPQGWNRYSYTLNNPLMFVDPSGHCWGFASGLRDTFYSTTCGNLDLAMTIVTSPDASVGQKVIAGGYIAVEGAAHAAVAIGTGIVAVKAAPVALTYATYAQSAAIAHPTAAAVVGGLGETAFECAATGGGCTALDFVAGGLTAGAAHRMSTPGGRTGPKGVDPNHHNANVLVRDANGSIIAHERFVSGNMTPDEMALGFPKNTLASHTEARAVTKHPLSEGQTMTITGQLPPCTSCRGYMNRAAAQSGATITYQWREGGYTNKWIAAH